MLVFQLTNDLVFPDPLLAEDGLLAVGGDLSPERLILAYKSGIFPWYSEGEPILWHAPDPRFILTPKYFKRSKSLRLLINKNVYHCTVNEDFDGVIDYCASIPRKDQDDTWITGEMKDAYITLNKMGFAYSIEVRDQNGLLSGGLYGIKLGKVFFGESMFSLEPNTSKIALSYLVDNFDIGLIDAQVYTAHMESMGAYHIGLNTFLTLLNRLI